MAEIDMELSFDRKQRVITIAATDSVDLREFYTKIRGWEEQNISDPIVVRGAGRALLPDGSRTVPVITLLGWRIGSPEPLSIVGGYLGAIDDGGIAVSPVEPRSEDMIKLEH